MPTVHIHVQSYIRTYMLRLSSKSHLHKTARLHSPNCGMISLMQKSPNSSPPTTETTVRGFLKNPGKIPGRGQGPIGAEQTRGGYSL